MKRLLLYAVLLMLVVWLLWPTSDIATPDWDVLVTDTDGHPITGAEVSVFSQQHTLESGGSVATHIPESGPIRRAQGKLWGTRGGASFEGAGNTRSVVEGLRGLLAGEG